MLRCSGKLASFAAVCLTVFLCTGSVQAASGGLWYYYDFHVDAAHASGIDGRGVKIADVDTMVNVSVPWLSDAEIITRDVNITQYYGAVSPVTTDFDLAYHATDMISVLAGNGTGATYGKAPLGVAPKATIYHYAAVTTEDDAVTGGDAYEGAFQAALADNVDIIAIPAGGLSYYERQFPYVLEAIKRGIPIVIAHSNSKAALDKRTRPAVYTDAKGKTLSFDLLPTADAADEICYWPGMVTVQAVKENRSLQNSSNIQDSGVDVAAPGPDVMMEFYEWGHFEAQGGGCSCASTLTAGYLALAMQKWPQATGNQILHLLLRSAEAGRTGNKAVLNKTTQKDLSALTRDKNTGHGIVNLDYMLSTNPAVYPDYNPVLYKDLEQLYKNAVARGAKEELQAAWVKTIAKEMQWQLKACGEAEPKFLTEMVGETPHPSASQTPSPQGEGKVIADGKVPTSPQPEAASGHFDELSDRDAEEADPEAVPEPVDEPAVQETQTTAPNPVLRFAVLVLIAALLSVGAYFTYGKKQGSDKDKI